MSFSDAYIDSGEHEEGLALLFRAEKLMKSNDDPTMLNRVYSKIIEGYELYGDRGVLKKYTKLKKQIEKIVIQKTLKLVFKKLKCSGLFV